MKKKYLALGNWFDKETGDPKTNLGELSEGIGKANRKPYQITSTDSPITVDGTYPAGTIISATMTLTPDVSSKPNVKINAAQ